MRSTSCGGPSTGTRSARPCRCRGRFPARAVSRVPFFRHQNPACRGRDGRGGRGRKVQAAVQRLQLLERWVGCKHVRDALTTGGAGAAAVALEKLQLVGLHAREAAHPFAHGFQLHQFGCISPTICAMASIVVAQEAVFLRHLVAHDRPHHQPQRQRQRQPQHQPHEWAHHRLALSRCLQGDKVTAGARQRHHHECQIRPGQHHLSALKLQHAGALHAAVGDGRSASLDFVHGFIHAVQPAAVHRTRAQRAA